ncbi:matrix metalloproteinase-9-like [Pseudonaja textilis]|uniref:matrix metalloproteinase-9-like n=1 Tax=Pseudonaja textilis TaxID=8673 RepID=UPI000EAA1BC6|nr:matrix metalloproteinase-9-like [Pseudonaja textilis]
MVACLLCLLFACNLLPVLLAGKGSSCVFPFVFNGRPYSSCTRDGAIDEQLWCSTTSNYDTDGLWKPCVLQEHGGNSGGKSCVFPFVYKNQTFYTCTKEEKGRFWCATTRNYDKDLEWSYCADTRLDANPKGPCVFPFIFNHTSYSSCTTDGISNKKPWCSLTKNYDIDFQWTYCEPSGRMVACKGFIVYFFVLSEVMFT